MTPAEFKLQFGHDLSAVETNWNYTAPGLAWKLQFGHDLSAMETSITMRGLIGFFMLQFGHGLSAVETAKDFKVPWPIKT